DKNSEEEVEDPSITFEEFTKVDLRVAEIIQATKMENADKLLKLQLDVGSEKRQVVSGIAEYYEPEELVGQKVICVTNLHPIKLRGELSQGMVLAGEDEERRLSIATIDQSLPNGSRVK